MGINLSNLEAIKATHGYDCAIEHLDAKITARIDHISKTTPCVRLGIIDLIRRMTNHKTVQLLTSAVFKRLVPSNPPTAKTSPPVLMIDTPLRRDRIGVTCVQIRFKGQ